VSVCCSLWVNCLSANGHWILLSFEFVSEIFKVVVFGGGIA